MSKQLYYIENCGCDATTYGLVELTDAEYECISAALQNLNRNSYYGCMPTIHFYKASWDEFREVEISDATTKNYWDDEYIDDADRLYFGDKMYTWREQYAKWYKRDELF